MPTVAGLSIAPVKSTALVHPDRVTIRPFGVVENRRFYVAERGGRLASGSNHGSLMQVRSRYDAETEWLALCFPDGSIVEGTATSLGDPVQTNFWSRWVRGRAVLGPWSDALSAHCGHPLVLVRPDTEGDANDKDPVSLFSSESAEELDRRSGRAATPLDRRRFRMLVEVRGCGPHQEDTWTGRPVRLGEAVVRIEGPIDRCVVTTLDPDTGVKDFETLKALVAYRGVDPNGGIDFGVSATVLHPGAVRVGDPVEPLAG